MDDLRKSAPHVVRNREPILAVLREVLPPRGLVLEIASGTGEHVIHFAQHLPGLAFQPTDPNAEARQSVAAWVAASDITNIRPPVALDASSLPWPVKVADAVICINMIHISPWRATEGLMKGAAAILPPGGVLYLYGPYRRRDVPTAPSNEDFDADLRGRNPAWGLRLLEDVAELAGQSGLAPERFVEMPANNLSVVFRKL